MREKPTLLTDADIHTDNKYKGVEALKSEWGFKKINAGEGESKKLFSGEVQKEIWGRG